MSQVDPVALLDTVLDAIEDGNMDEVRAAARLARMAYPKGSTLPAATDFFAKLKDHGFYRCDKDRICVLVPKGSDFSISEWDQRSNGDWYDGFGDETDVLYNIIENGIEDTFGELLTYDELKARFPA